MYQTRVLAAGKLVLNVDAQVGNQTASEYAQPTLWGWLDARERGLCLTFGGRRSSGAISRMAQRR